MFLFQYFCLGLQWYEQKKLLDISDIFLLLWFYSRVLGKGANRGAAYDLEIPVCFIFQVHVKGIA